MARVRSNSTERGTTMHHGDTQKMDAWDAVYNAAISAAFDARVYGTPDDATGPLSGAADHVARNAGLPRDHAVVVDALNAAGFDTPQ